MTPNHKSRPALAWAGPSLVALAAMTATLPAQAVVGMVNFETNPVLAQAPSNYVAMPGPQTFVTPQATFSSGVALGFATFVPRVAAMLQPKG